LIAKNLEARYRWNSISWRVSHIVFKKINNSLTLSVEYKKELKYAADLSVVDLGSGKRKIWMPAELCDIEPGNPYRVKLSDRETAQMIRYACNSPSDNAKSIVGPGFSTLGLAPPAAPANGFGIEIDTSMSVVPGRELNQPRLTYRVGNPKVHNGSWNILDVKFHRAVTVSSWWILVVQDRRKSLTGGEDPRLKEIVRGFREKLKNSGITMPDGTPRVLPLTEFPHPNRDPRGEQALDNIRRIIAEAVKTVPKPSFILVLLGNRDHFVYPGIKVTPAPIFFLS
jgi:eukaryotic translation initiation factor 2C